MGLDEAIDELHQWAASNGHLEDPVVVGLGNAAQDPTVARFWSRRDLAVDLPKDRIRTNLAIRAGRLLTVLRNALVFSPIILTWYAIADVTDALGGRTQTSELSFVEYWQTGGSGGDEFFTLSEVATVAVFVVLGLVALTLVAAGLAGLGQRSLARSQATAERQRLRVAYGLSVALLPQADATEQSIVDSVSSAVSNLGSLTTMAVEASDRLVAVATTFNALVPSLASLDNELVSLTSRIDALVVNVEQLDHNARTNAATVSSMYEALGDTRDIMTQAMASLADTAERVRSDLDLVALATSNGEGA